MVLLISWLSHFPQEAQLSLDSYLILMNILQDRKCQRDPFHERTAAWVLRDKTKHLIWDHRCWYKGNCKGRRFLCDYFLLILLQNRTRPHEDQRSKHLLPGQHALFTVFPWFNVACNECSHYWCVIWNAVRFVCDRCWRSTRFLWEFTV